MTVKTQSPLIEVVFMYSLDNEGFIVFQVSLVNLKKKIVKNEDFSLTAECDVDQFDEEGYLHFREL